MYIPLAYCMPEKWPTTRKGLRHLYYTLSSDDSVKIQKAMVELFPDEAEYRAFILGPNGQMRIYQMCSPYFFESAHDLIEKLDGPLKKQRAQDLSQELWTQWCRWVRPWINVAAPVAAN